MSAITTTAGAIITAGVIGAGASVAASSMAAGAQEDANAANAANVSNTNQLNYNMFRQSRGDGGYSFLPYYAGAGDERALYERAQQYSNAMRGQSVDQQLADYQNIIRAQQPMIDATTGLVSDLYDGKTLEQRLAEARPVEDARRQVANSAMLALGSEQNRINAEEMRKGYSGGGSFASNRMIQGSVMPRQQIAGVTLQNAMGRQQIMDSDRGMRFQNLNEPVNRATSLIRLKQLPNQALNQNFSDSMQPYNFFKLGQGNFRYDQMPTVQPVASTGQLAMQGIGGLAGVAGNYFANQQLISAINNQNISPSSTAVNNISFGGVPAGYSAAGIVPIK